MISNKDFLNCANIINSKTRNGAANHIIVGGGIHKEISNIVKISKRLGIIEKVKINIKNKK